MFANSFRFTALNFTRPHSYRFVSVGTHKTPEYSASIENEENLLQLIFMRVKLYASASKPLKTCDSPRSDVSVRALIRVEDILSICFEL